jgi:ketosteroid isomerase-like protein
MVFPGFGGVSRGREAFVASFVDFCTNARVITAKERGRQINITGSTAVASFEFEIDNERGGERVRSTGRDLWVLAKEEAPWVAVWRTMLDVRETGT